MKYKSQAINLISLIVVVLLLAACTTAQPETALAPPTTLPALPTSTTVPPTATTEPTPEPTIILPEAPELNPSPRGYVSITYDIESDMVILFGGQLPGHAMKESDETWAYDLDSNTWTNMMPASSPPAKAAVDLVYDSESDRVILFGGGYGDNDTWAYDYNTNTWTELSKGPGDHLGYRMAYDSESDRCILFGGMGYPSLSLFNDTWAYDFNSDTWTEMQPSTSPSPRNFHAMTYDAQADRVILFGGSDWDENMRDRFLMDTWAYDFNTNTWQELEHSAGEYPAARFYHALAYNAVADRTVMLGGNGGSPAIWLYDYSANTWTNLEPTENPGIRSRHAMLYSSASDRVILFGGQVGSKRLVFTDDTWIFDFNTATWTDVTRRP